MNNSRIRGKRAAKNTIRTIAQFISDELYKHSDQELRSIAKLSSQMSDTNCWWIEYYLKDAIIQLSTSVISNRKTSKITKKHFSHPKIIQSKQIQ
jgi:hypothetical protein